MLQQYYGQNKLHFYNMMIMMYTLYQTNTLNWILIALAH